MPADLRARAMAGPMRAMAGADVEIDFDTDAALIAGTRVEGADRAIDVTVRQFLDTVRKQTLAGDNTDRAEETEEAEETEDAEEAEARQ